MSLSDTTIKNAKPTDKPYKLADDKGMYLLVNPNGSKYLALPDFVGCILHIVRCNLYADIDKYTKING
jgi:hypothetical protein